MNTPFKPFLQTLFFESARTLYPTLELKTPSCIEISEATQEKFGHYQCNNAMKWAKILKRKPQEIAQELAASLHSSEKIDSLKIEGPGFINIFLKPDALAAKIETLLKGDRLGIQAPVHPENILIDFSSPNIAKEMHVGHLRSTIIGDSLARLFEFLGHEVHRINHIGDWGTSFGMLIAFIKQNHPELQNEAEHLSLEDLALWYKQSKACFDVDPAFKKTSQLEVVKLQSGDPENKKIWEVLCAISAKAYREIYALLDIRIEDRGESFYNSLLPFIISDLESKNLIEISEGAKCVFLEEFKSREGTPLPLMVQKSDGGYNYDTTDMAAIWHRIHEDKADRIIYVTDQGQSTHFQMIFKAAEKAGYLNHAKTRTDHVGFGLVLGSDGKKFRSRSGDTEKLIDLLTTAIEEAKKILIQRIPDLKEPELSKAAKDLGLGAVKYSDLSSHRQSDYVFSYEKMLRFEGNTAAFIMYSYVRVGGIKRKVEASGQIASAQEPITLNHPSEIALALHLARFEEHLLQMAEDLLPHHLTDYLYNLSEKFNAFFRDCRVEGSEFQGSRLKLAEATAKVLKKGLELLGISPLERM